jgi:phosphoglycolate phosphatase-like HAD superfamily hydrolase
VTRPDPEADRRRPVAGLRTPADPLAGIDLVIFDKDGTLIDFHAMWTAWVGELAGRVAAAAGRSLDGPIHEVMGLDVSTGRIRPEGGLAATPMVRLRAALERALAGAGGEPAACIAEAADLIYHVTVLMEARGFGWSEVAETLRERHS